MSKLARSIHNTIDLIENTSIIEGRLELFKLNRELGQSMASGDWDGLDDELAAVIAGLRSSQDALYNKMGV